MARDRRGKYHGPHARIFPTTGLLRGVPVKNKIAPWYLKRWGSRPADKRLRRLAEVA